MNNPLTLIVYTGGAAGMLVSALIDDTDIEFDKWHFEYREKIPVRSHWKHGLAEWQNGYNFDAMDEYYDMVIASRSSLASHFSRYHINRKHDFIMIDSSSPFAAEWCAERFAKNTSISKSHGVFDKNTNIRINDVCKKHTDKIIVMEDILDGKLIDILKQWVHTPLNDELYQAWLKANV